MRPRSSALSRLPGRPHGFSCSSGWPICQTAVISPGERSSKTRGRGPGHRSNMCTANSSQSTSCRRRSVAEAFAEGRIVHEADGLVAFVPAAARQPFETWILPAVREPHFHAAPPARAAALAAFTQRVVGRLADVLPGTDFNWWLHEAAWSGPLADGPAADRWHWHLELLPRATELAGFELATGCHITALPPVEAAARLRGR